MFVLQIIVYVVLPPPTPDCKKTTRTAEYAAVAARASYKRDLVTASTTKNITIKPDMTPSRHTTGRMYASAQIGPMSITIPTTEINTEETFSILWSFGHTVPSLRSETKSFGASLQNHCLSQGMPLGFHGLPNANFSRKIRPGDFVLG
jgi:hypothetical protein